VQPVGTFLQQRQHRQAGSCIHVAGPLVVHPKDLPDVTLARRNALNWHAMLIVMRLVRGAGVWVTSEVLLSTRGAYDCLRMRTSQSFGNHSAELQAAGVWQLIRSVAKLYASVKQSIPGSCTYERTSCCCKPFRKGSAGLTLSYISGRPIRRDRTPCCRTVSS
jgi:hypothetical protein